MKIYERLAQVYDAGGWGKFSELYIGLIAQLFNEHGIKQARILDVACGTGVLAIALAKQGHSVQGIDISPEMVAFAKTKSSDIANLSFDVQNMTAFKVSGEYDLVTCTFDSLNYLIIVDELKAMFGCVARSLRKSGLFVFDSNTKQHYVSVGKVSQNHEIGEETVHHESGYDPVENKATTLFKFADGAEEIHQQRPYDLSELSPLLGGSGFQVVKTMSWFDNRPYDNESRRLICVAQKHF